MRRFFNWLMRVLDDPVARNPNHPKNNPENIRNNFRPF